MNIPRVWTKAERTISGKLGPKHLTAWGWSASDRGEAKRRADEKLQRMVSRVEQGTELSRDYSYGSGPLREEIIQELHTRAGDLAAIITRNSYGCLVLNASQAMFVDIDLPKPGVVQRVWRFFKREKSLEEELLDKVKTAVRDISTASFRIYRTAGGFRLLFTDRLFLAGSSESETMMKAVFADRAYMKLCRLQESFRARMTPKPWRCGSSNPPNRFPRENSLDRERFATWLDEYNAKIANLSTCRLLEEIGNGWIHEEVQPIVKLHDEVTKMNTGLPLA